MNLLKMFLIILLFFSGCKRDVVPLPIITTYDVTNITCTTATSGGGITSDGGLHINDRGLCWGRSENPTKNDSFISFKGSPFSYTIRNLETNSNYYVRAYATNSAGTGYGESIQFCTKSPDPNYDPHSVIGTWSRYATYGDFAGYQPDYLGYTTISEFTKDSIHFVRINGDILSNYRFTISGDHIIESDQTYKFQMNITGDTLTFTYEYYSRLY